MDFLLDLNGQAAKSYLMDSNAMLSSSQKDYLTSDLSELEKKIEKNVTHKVTEKLIKALRQIDLKNDNEHDFQSFETETKPKPQANHGKQVHRYIYCDHCNVNIAGIRYKCVQCPDFDLCQDCEALVPNVHTDDHFFLKITEPLNKKCFFLPETLIDLQAPVCSFGIHDDSLFTKSKNCNSREKPKVDIKADKESKEPEASSSLQTGKNNQSKTEKKSKYIDRASRKAEKLK